MALTDISLWGIMLILLLYAGCVALFYFTDRKSMNQLLRVSFYYVLSMTVIMGITWGLDYLNKWWATLLWTVIVSLALSSLILRKSKLWNKHLLLPVHISVFSGLLVAVLIAHLLLPVHQPLFLPAMIAVQAAFMLHAVTKGLKTYISSLRHTQTHYQYLLANGASHLEAILPSVRRSLRAVLLSVMRKMSAPLVITLPLLLCGLLMAGIDPLTSVLFSVLLTFAVLCDCMMTILLIIAIADKFVFDRSGRFLL